MKFSRPVVFFLSVATLITGCKCTDQKQRGKRSSSTKQEVRINIVNEPGSLDPRKARALSDVNLVRTFMEGLMRINKDGVTSPALAKNYSVSKDNKIYEFQLKETTWSNGDPLTAHDFVYAWKKILSPDFPADNAFSLFAIKNGKPVKDGVLPMSMLGIRAKDDYTLVVELEHPVPYFLEMVSLPSFFPVNRRIDRENPNWFLNADTFVSNGPFKIENWKHNNEIVAVKNDKYWDADVVNLEKINMIMVDAETGFRMFENKELDWEGSPYSTIPMDALPDLKEKQLVQADPFLGTYWIRTNTAVFPLNSLKIRKALAVAIDRSEIVNHVLQGGQTPAYGIVPTSIGLQDTPYFQDADREEASRLLDMAVQEENVNIEKFPELSLTYPATTNNHRIAQTIQQQWQDTLGISVRLEPLETKTYFERLSNGDFQLACGSWVADFRDAINFLEVFKTKNIAMNRTNWESPNYMKAIEDSYLATTGEDRLESLRKSEKELMEEMPVIPVYHFTLLHTKNDSLKDVILTDGGHLDFKWAYVQ